ncbi:MAG: DNA polymerase III subunit delta' [Clostridiaceae bacterium]|nr:DNA polymerase III subunit delta' [Clostridiaceae bacterium]
MSFDNITGNNKVKDFLNKSLKENHVSHSYLFVGIDGIGKTLFAQEFARKLLCIDQEESENCLSCIKMKSGNHPDFEKIEPEEGIIKIDTIRQLQEKIVQKPITSKRKVYLIKDSEYMKAEAQNCLLKTLEEPPEYAIIILTTANESKLLPTIRSRCLKVSFDAIPEETIIKYINENNSSEIDNNLISMSEGSIGKAILLQEKKDIYESVTNILDEIQNEDMNTLWKKAELLYKQKDNIQDILSYINVYLYKTKNLNKINCIKYVEDTKKRLASNSNYDMSIDYLLIKLWEGINEKYSRSSI